MNDLRHDPDAHAADPREATQYDLLTVTLPARRIDPADLRTVAMPPLRSADARQRDAEARDLPRHSGPERIDAELAALRDAIERIADAVTVLMLERDIAREREGPSGVMPEPDWSKAPGLSRWWAVDEDGNARWFWPQPILGKQGWYVDINPCYMVVTSKSAGTVELNGHDWRQTLRCKPGFVP